MIKNQKCGKKITALTALSILPLCIVITGGFFTWILLLSVCHLMLQDTAHFHDCYYSMPTTTEVDHFEIQMKCQELVSLVGNTQQLRFCQISLLVDISFLLLSHPSKRKLCLFLTYWFYFAFYKIPVSSNLWLFLSSICFDVLNQQLRYLTINFITRFTFQK